MFYSLIKPKPVTNVEWRENMTRDKTAVGVCLFLHGHELTHYYSSPHHYSLYSYTLKVQVAKQDSGASESLLCFVLHCVCE